MDRVEVFSKNAAVRNALWWDKLYIGDVDILYLWHASGDHHALHLVGALVVGAHDCVLFA